MSKSGARILVVDDEIEILRALQRSLTAHGFEVFTASSGEDALEAITLHRPDLLLLDPPSRRHFARTDCPRGNWLG